MGRFKRGGFVFIWYLADHAPVHVHVIKDGREVAKWDLEKNRLMVGVASRKLTHIISQLIQEGVFSEIIKNKKSHI
jgi:hypothetical protein